MPALGRPGGDLSAWIGKPQRPDLDMQRFITELGKRQPRLPAALIRRWARCYGALVSQLLDGGDLGAEVAPGLYEAELNHLHAAEWARCADDVLWRRTKLGLHYSPAQRAQVAQWWAARHGAAVSSTPCTQGATCS